MPRLKLGNRRDRSEKLKADSRGSAQQREAWRLIKSLIEQELTAHQRGILLAHVFHQKPWCGGTGAGTSPLLLGPGRG